MESLLAPRGSTKLQVQELEFLEAGNAFLNLTLQSYFPVAKFIRHDEIIW